MPEGRGLFEVARERIRTRHLSFRTEQAHLHWMRRYVKFHGRRHPRDMGAAEVEALLTHLDVEAKVGASTQNQALQALLFLYRQMLGIGAVLVAPIELLAGRLRLFRSRAIP
jgi:Phage integrase, N-terminal SAM-like domain